MLTLALAIGIIADHLHSALPLQTFVQQIFSLTAVRCLQQ